MLNPLPYEVAFNDAERKLKAAVTAGDVNEYMRQHLRKMKIKAFMQHHHHYPERSMGAWYLFKPEENYQ